MSCTTRLSSHHKHPDPPNFCRCRKSAGKITAAIYSDSQQMSALSCATVLNLDFCKVPLPHNYVIGSTLIHDICSSSSSSKLRRICKIQSAAAKSLANFQSSLKLYNSFVILSEEFGFVCYMSAVGHSPNWLSYTCLHPLFSVS